MLHFFNNFLQLWSEAYFALFCLLREGIVFGASFVVVRFFWHWSLVAFLWFVVPTLVQISIFKPWLPNGAQSWAQTHWEVSEGPVPHVGMGPTASFEMLAANTILLVRIPKQGMEEIVTNWTTPSVETRKAIYLPNLPWEFKLPAEIIHLVQNSFSGLIMVCSRQ